MTPPTASPLPDRGRRRPRDGCELPGAAALPAQPPGTDLLLGCGFRCCVDRLGTAQSLGPAGIFYLAEDIISISISRWL